MTEVILCIIAEGGQAWEFRHSEGVPVPIPGDLIDLDDSPANVGDMEERSYRVIRRGFLYRDEYVHVTLWVEPAPD